jgi:hypothetical protein
VHEVPRSAELPRSRQQWCRIWERQQPQSGISTVPGGHEGLPVACMTRRGSAHRQPQWQGLQVVPVTGPVGSALAGLS